MPFGFLSAIPQLLGKGASAVVGGVKKVPGLFGQMGREDEDTFLTPGINGSAPSPTFRRPQLGALQRGPNAGVTDIPDVGDPRTVSTFPDHPSPLMPPPNIRPRPAAPITSQGGPTFRPQTPEEEITAARATNAQNYKPPTGFGGRLKAAALPALKGLLAGGASGDLGGALGGLIGGTGAGLVAPRATYDADFEQRQLPQLLARQKREQENQVFQEARNKAALEDQYRRGQIAGMPSADEARAEREADLKYKAAQTEAMGRRDNSGKDALINTPGGLYNIGTGQIVPGTTRPQTPQRAQRFKVDDTLVDEAGNVIYQGGGRQTKTAEKRKAVDDFNKLKADTDFWGQKLAVAKQSGDATKIQEAEIEYNNAFQKENDAARTVAETYPDEFEGGPGIGGRAYIKAKPQQPRQRPKAAGRPGRTAISLEEAAKLLQ